MRHPSEMPSLVYADSEGQIYDLPELKMAGRSGRVLHPVDLRDLIPLPIPRPLLPPSTGQVPMPILKSRA